MDKNLISWDLVSGIKLLILLLLNYLSVLLGGNKVFSFSLKYLRDVNFFRIIANLTNGLVVVFIVSCHGLS